MGLIWAMKKYNSKIHSKGLVHHGCINNLKQILPEIPQKKKKKYQLNRLTIYFPTSTLDPTNINLSEPDQG